VVGQFSDKRRTMHPDIIDDYMLENCRDERRGLETGRAMDCGLERS